MRTTETITDVAVDAARLLSGLHAGELAEARRMDGARVAPAFWRLVARHPERVGQGELERVWSAIVAILAQLTPRPRQDDAASQPFLHESSRRLGAVLCDGGDPGWPDGGGPEPRPVFSELRLARLLASRGAQREVLLRRAGVTLSRSMTPGTGINVADVAHALLTPDASNRAIARAYYARLDRAVYAAADTQG